MTREDRARWDARYAAFDPGEEKPPHPLLIERLLCVQADLDRFRFPPAAFDLICVFRFLNRGLFPALVRGLKPGGLLIYETFNWRWIEERPDVNPDYMLRPGELLEAFGGLDVVVHSEQGVRSQLVARRPI
jgi:tellurite methyltransferase